MAREIVYTYNIDPDDEGEYTDEDIREIVESINRVLDSCDGPGQGLSFRGVEESAYGE
jgi:hypothetical protein